MHQPDSVARIGGDPEVLESFYREHVEAVQRFVARRVSDPHLAADLTADVFVAAIDAAGGYRASLGSPRAWLYGVARNVVAMHLRRQARESQALRRIEGRRLLDADGVQRTADRIDAEREARRLWTALQELDDQQRAVVELVAVDGLTPGEAAAVLGITGGAARVRLHRARQFLAAHSLSPSPLNQPTTEVTP